MRSSFGLLVLFLAMAACRPPVERLDYDREEEQILFLFNPERPLQIFFRETGQNTNWTSTTSSAAEREPPDSGPWELQFPDWVLIHARNSELQADTLRCLASATLLVLRARGFTVEPCLGEDEKCCTSEGVLFVGPGGKCRVRAGWTSEPGLCVSRPL